MEVITSTFGLEAWAEPWEVGWSRDRVPGLSACMSIPTHGAHQCQSSEEGLICLAPSFVVKNVNLFVRMYALLLWHYGEFSLQQVPPWRVPLLQKRWVKAHCCLIQLAHEPDPGTQKSNLRAQPISLSGSHFSHFTDYGNNANLRTNTKMCVSFIKYSSKKRIEQQNKRTELQFKNSFQTAPQ